MRTFVVAALALSHCLLLTAFPNPRSAMPPVVLIPGDGGSQIEAKLNKPSVVHYICEKKTSDFFDLWLNLQLLVPLVLDCWVDNMRLVYDNATRTTSNSPGVETRIPGFGMTDSVEYLDPSKVSPSRYFVNVVESLIPFGYARGRNIRGAPYDFRKAPNELAEYFTNLTKLIEDTYENASRSRVVLLVHSMGGPMMHYFLTRKTQEWKDKYIGSLVSLSGAWGGSMKALKVAAAGDNLGIFVLSSLTLRIEQRSCPSLQFLLPSPRFWSETEIIVSRPGRNYTANDYESFFKDVGFPEGYEMYKDVKDLVDPTQPPGVEVHCLHGVGVPTWEQIIYAKDSDFPDKPRTLVNGDGDGTVNVRSLEVCTTWENKQKHPVYHVTFPGVDHLEILRNEGVLKYVTKLIKNYAKVERRRLARLSRG